MSLLDVMLRGGVIMWLILICFLVSVAVVVDRILVLRRASVDYREFMTKFRSLYRRGDPAGVLAFCSQKNVPVANVIRRGILKQGHGQQQVREAIEGAGREEIFRLECRLSFLASIAAVAPMLGFLGTVIGLITAFHSIDAHGASAGAGTLAGGVWQALLPTAFGLAVGLPVHLFYNYCVSKVGKIAHAMELASTEFLELLEVKALHEPHIRSERKAVDTRELVYEEDEFFRRKR